MRPFNIIILGLLLTQNLFSQKPCVDSDQLFVNTEVMPEPSPALSSVEQLVNGQFKSTDCGLVDGDKIIVQFTLNCKGEDFNYKTIKFNKEPLDCNFGEFIQSTLTWTIAKQKDKEVDFSGTIVFKVENSTFVLLSESVNNMTEKKKKKRKNKK